MTLYKAEGITDRFDVYWKTGDYLYVSCPKCGYITSLFEKSPLHCFGCGKTTEVKLDA